MSKAKSLWWSTLLLLALGACGPQQAPGPQAAAVAANTEMPLAPTDGVPQTPVGTPVPLRTAAPATTPAPAPAPTAQAPAPVPAAAPPAEARPRVARAARVPTAASLAAMGEVRAIEPIRERPSGTGTGAVIGGVLGGVVGNQFGHGNGRAAMTVLGAAGGAVAGNNVERNMNKRVVGYRVSVRLDNGQARTFTEPRLDGLRVGDRVRVDGKHIRRA